MIVELALAILLWLIERIELAIEEVL